jgi:ribosomal protein S18 acetylase RimI-like enzyme
VLILPNLGVDERHHRKGYGRQICQHLIKEAQAHYLKCKASDQPIAPILGLLVHPMNHGAKELYRSVGFRNYEYYYVDNSDDTKYEGMAVLLDSR